MNPVLWVNKSRLIKNFNLIKERTSSSFVCPMVKANAYGVGDTLVVGVLLEAGAKHFGVARVFEGEKLRRFFSGQDFEILVFNALTEDSLRSCVESDLIPVIGQENDLKVLESFPFKDLKRIKKVHLKLDLGMSRFGFSLVDAEPVAKRLKSLGLSLGGVCGHFATSEDFSLERGRSEELLASLVETAKSIGVSEELVHAPNTSAIERGRFKVGLRPGIALYGVSQYEENSLKGVLKLTAPLVAINGISEGEKVSYGGTWSTKEGARIGILPIGYADGLRRGLSNRIRVGLNGHVCSQVGVICMDYCMIDLGLECVAKEGDELILFDEKYSDLFEWAKLLETIPYEILTGLGDRIERKVF